MRLLLSSSQIGRADWRCFARVDGTPSPTDESTKPSKPHPYRSLVFGGDGVYIPFPSHNFLSYLGPNAYILLLDCRAERKKTQVCSKTTYDVIFKACADLPATVTQLVVLLGVPVRALAVRVPAKSC